jgi:hypothetical protein
MNLFLEQFSATTSFLLADIRWFEEQKVTIDVFTALLNCKVLNIILTKGTKSLNEKFQIAV